MDGQKKNFLKPSLGDIGIVIPASRSYNMSRIKAKNTKAELRLRKALWAKNIRFRIHPTGVIGKPDIFIAKYHLVIFVDGDFWHGYKWNENKDRIKSNADFWIAKIERNMKRDVNVNLALSQIGFTVMRFWEHQVKSELDKCVNQVVLYIESSKLSLIPDKE
ncbi:very short patch repair endonuclease [Pedobacter endophyticus]|uniref:Very short patch repair endonuclease n=1 Tax=Pedobacter endophyticus TaxID=2789740 RepID=A0A7U3SQ29_9SPHI|nr:very short patch repair endonuclease [Pedobacter endophyticus]QPH37871.1 very short patch repair endonuclease [Pedobacter endophyticus]